MQNLNFTDDLKICFPGMDVSDNSNDLKFYGSDWAKQYLPNMELD
jgi:hypothetical protein